MKRAVFVGTQPPSYEAQESGEVVKGGALDNIIQLMGIPQENFFEKFDYINVSAHHEPDGLSPENYRVDIRNIRPLLRGRRIVLFGPQVASAFEIEPRQFEWCRSFDHPTWTDFHGLFYVIPFPSPQNKLLTNPEFRGMVVRTLDMLLAFSHEEEPA